MKTTFRWVLGLLLCGATVGCYQRPLAPVTPTNPDDVEVYRQELAPFLQGAGTEASDPDESGADESSQADDQNADDAEAEE